MYKNRCLYLADLRIDNSISLCYYNDNRWICFKYRRVENQTVLEMMEEQSNENVTAALEYER